MKTCERCEMMKAALEEITRRAAGLAASLEFVRKELYPSGTQLALPVAPAVVPKVEVEQKVKAKIIRSVTPLAEGAIYTMVERARKGLRFQAKELGEKIGVSESTICKFLRGKTRLSYSVFMKMVAVLGLNPSAAVRWANEANAIRY